MKRYKSIIKENGVQLKEAGWSDSDLSRFFFSKEYDDYKHGDPKKAVSQLYSLTIDYLNDVEKNLELAGTFLASAIKDEVWKMIEKNFKRIKIK